MTSTSLFGKKEGININLEILNKEAHLPNKIMVFYRVFGVLPLFNIIDLKWPTYR